AMRLPSSSISLLKLPDDFLMLIPCLVPIFSGEDRTIVPRAVARSRMGSARAECAAQGKGPDIIRAFRRADQALRLPVTIVVPAVVIARAVAVVHRTRAVGVGSRGVVVTRIVAWPVIVRRGGCGRAARQGG